MTRHFRWVLLALLIAVPAVAGAQQQQGDARSFDYLSRARTLVQQRRYTAALATFDSLLRVAPGSRDAQLGRAQLLAWTGRLTEAIRVYERWVEAHPKDVEAAELFALALTWAGHLDLAERVYQLLAIAGSPEAERGLARIKARRGDLDGAERQWRGIVTNRPADSDAWFGLAQTLRSQNRLREARIALARAAQLDPDNRDARDQLRWVEASLAPRIEPTVASTNDSDDNRLTTIGLVAAVAAPWDGDLSLRGQRRAARIGALRASSAAAAVAATTNIRQLTLRGSVGASRLENEATAPIGPTRDILTFAATASAKVSRRVHIGAGIGRGPFDETAPLIRRGIVITTVGGGASVDIGRGLALSGSFERVELDGGTANSRTGGVASLTWRAPLILSLGTSLRAFGYTVDPIEGYFAPRRYVLGEATARFAIGRQLGWSVTVDGGIGAQAVELHAAGSDTQPAARGGLSVSFRPTPGLEWALSGMATNAASSATSGLSGYRSSNVSAHARVSF